MPKPPPNPPAAVKAAFDAMPPAVAHRLGELREQIYEAALETQAGPLTETLKWGQPAYLTDTTKSGTTIRLGWSEKSPETCALYVHCQTDLVGRFRQLYPVEFTYEDNRAVHIPVAGDYAKTALHQIAAMALTYHRDKKGGRK